MNEHLELTNNKESKRVTNIQECINNLNSDKTDSEIKTTKQAKKTTSRPQKTTAQKLAELEAERTKLIEKKRKEDTHEKIIMGAIFKNFLRCLYDDNKNQFSLLIDIIEKNREDMKISKKDIVVFDKIINEIETNVYNIEEK